MSEQPQKVAEYVELSSPEDRLPLACARALRHYRRGQTVALYTTDPAQAAELDERLWTFQQNSFVPHVRLEEAEEPLIEPVVIFSGEPPDIEADVLVLVQADELPSWFGRFRRLCDFAEVYDEQRRRAARERYSACQEAGYRMRFSRPGGSG
jgi:DNA polymerase-3 subunit chi